MKETKPKFIFFQRYSGFTLIEMLIVLAIISLITTLMLANLRKGEKKNALRRAAQQVALDTKRAQSMALEAKNYPGENQVPLGGYGIYFNTSSNRSYILFADCNDPPNFAYNSTSTPCGALANKPEKLETLELKENISIQALLIGVSSTSTVNIVFNPPDPNTFINGGAEATITLRNIDGDTVNVYVSTAGEVEIGK